VTRIPAGPQFLDVVTGGAKADEQHFPGAPPAAVALLERALRRRDRVLERRDGFGAAAPGQPEILVRPQMKRAFGIAPAFSRISGSMCTMTVSAVTSCTVIVGTEPSGSRW
jgi:hypothetical protein